MTHLTIENVTKTYFLEGNKIDAVSNITLGINKGEFVSIVGHSGSGKTTLLSIIGGIARPTSGRVVFEGDDLYALDSDRLSGYRCEKIGFMFQFSSLLPVLTAKENILLSVLFKSNGGASDVHEEKAVGLLKMVGLGDKINAYPSQLSGGQQRRVAIARAFMNDPELILADEPTGDLDEETEAEMMRFFKSMNAGKNITFIMVTHNSDLAMQTGRRLRMSNGAIAEL